MNCGSKYSYYDYEEAYYHMHYAKCKEIGIDLLTRLTDNKSKLLLKKLKSYEYRYNEPDKSTILEDVKI